MAQRFFQWIAGERRGEVVVFDDIVEEDGMTFITFKDNSRVNTDLVAEINQTQLDGKMVAEVESPHNVWTFKDKTDFNKTRVEQDWESQIKYEVPSVEEIAHADMTGPEGGVVNPQKLKKIIELVPPRPTRNKFGRIANTGDLMGEYKEPITPTAKVEQSAPVKPSVNVSDPVYIMMEKSKKVDTEVNMTLTISLPSAHLFDVVRDSFDDGGKKALEYIIENIDISDIKTALKKGIEEMYGPNQDPEDNKIIPAKGVLLTEHVGTELFEPACVEEPVVRDVSPEKMEEVQKAIDKQVKDIGKRAAKITEDNG